MRSIAATDEFRAAAGRFATGVTVVATRDDDRVHGVTVSSFASLSLNPLLVTVSIARGSRLLPLVRSGGCFGVSVLAHGQREVGDRFARRGREPEVGTFEGVPTTTAVTGAPIVTGCVSWFDCELADVIPGGDHEILVGRVVRTGGDGGEPLVHWAGGYRQLRADAPAAPDLAGASDGLAVALWLLGVAPAEMLAAQLALEPALAGLAAAAGTAEQWDALDDLVARSEAVVDLPDEFNALALAAHDLVATTAGNRVLAAALGSLRRVQSEHFRDLGSRASAVAAVAEHRELADALRSGDARRSADLMRAHLEGVGSRLLG